MSIRVSDGPKGPWDELTLGFAQTSFSDFRAVEAWAKLAITTVLFLECERIVHIQDRQLSEKRRQWWERQRRHGLCHAVRQHVATEELRYMGKRLLGRICGLKPFFYRHEIQQITVYFNENATVECH